LTSLIYTSFALDDGTRRDHNVLVALLVEQDERRCARADAQAAEEAAAEAAAEEAEEEDAFDACMRAEVRQVVEAGLSRALGGGGDIDVTNMANSTVTPIAEACPGMESVDDVTTMLAAKNAVPTTPVPEEQPRRRSTRSTSH
jgi:hypothetical protein